MIVGVLGGGQLARMMALAGHPLGVRLRVLDPATDACAAVAAEHIRAAWDDEAGLARLAEGAVAVTCEFENVPAASARGLAARVPVRPGPAALAVGRDRLEERRLFEALGIPVAPYARVDEAGDLAAAVAQVGLPAFLKRRELGYDGKGQRLVTRPEEAEPAWEALGRAPAILEARVAFSREVSAVAVRGLDGRILHYPLSENVHGGGILRTARSRPGDPRADEARDYAERILRALDYVGVLALELFEVDGRLLANEFAPRVHNSGHWTIEGAETSQFENHLRAVLGLPLGSTAPVGHAAMVNFIGRMPDPAAVLALPGVHLHDYGKAPRPGRKVGHATVRADDERTLEAVLARLQALAAA
ncbi:5-(carboxyamino)imidazole ribonucleotide synthase [Inmirania thermothiophila]|uniref:N5-carboxyaminoimidazole ribonucleotide synthase n=1 Tax=Inmirania thermothiophila TaxID=1750597 RepID=A0A3N1Y1X2_9GAMM|nr:5-(carboxyamino)imidazole ribonucleotide synthase [Inmirania thermothiophila]ROR32508.1 5-(carboxyamino)imidazole ribonucleotide synthase [Inmirania thermothiophila]